MLAMNCGSIGEMPPSTRVTVEFAERMAGAFAIEDVIPRTARMLAEGTGAVRADVWLRVGNELRAEGSWPSPSVERVSLAEEDQILRKEISRLMPHLYPTAAKPLPQTLHARLRDYIG